MKTVTQRPAVKHFDLSANCSERCSLLRSIICARMFVAQTTAINTLANGNQGAISEISLHVISANNGEDPMEKLIISVS